jgi:hypothetical protein
VNRTRRLASSDSKLGQRRPIVGDGQRVSKRRGGKFDLVQPDAVTLGGEPGDQRAAARSYRLRAGAEQQDEPQGGATGDVAREAARQHQP